MTMNKRAQKTFVCENCNETWVGDRKFCTDRCKKLLECKAKGTTKFLKTVVAQLFQKMIRAEEGATEDGYKLVIVKGKPGTVTPVYRRRGMCVCVTCGASHAWDSGIKGMHTGHFLASRRSSILLEEDNVAPQCAHCNVYCDGAASEFRFWMELTRGLQRIERLQVLKTQSVSFTREELVDKWFEYAERLKTAKKRMKSGS